MKLIQLLARHEGDAEIIRKKEGIRIFYTNDQPGMQNGRSKYLYVSLKLEGKKISINRTRLLSFSENLKIHLIDNSDPHSKGTNHTEFSTIHTHFLHNKLLKDIESYRLHHLTA